MLTDRTELQGAVLDDVRARASWEARQRIWYLLRTEGLRRKNKPFPHAADLHFPLVDTSIEKLKPFYAQQLYASECVASFVAKDARFASRAADAAYWLDYEIRQRSSFETDYLFWIDMMLERGRAILKVHWDTEGDCVAFDPLSPQEVIVPSHTRELQRADRIVHVRRLSEAQYRANTRYRQGEDLIKRIKGKTPQQAGENTLDDKNRIEGITCATSPDEILLWEIYQKDGNKVVVDTLAPGAPDEVIRPRFRLPYRHETVRGESVTLYPFVDLAHEARDKGWYSSRGVAELLAHHEASLCRMWNEKHDAMAFYNRPLYYSERDLPNTANISTVPGTILPFAIQPVKHERPPMSWDEEMTSTRLIAEQRVAMPDFGLTNQRNNPQARSGTSSRSATEVREISGLMGMSADLRSRITRRALGAVYRQAWALLIQFRSRAEVEFLRDGESTSIEPDARQAIYYIEPSGSADGWNKEQGFQKAVARAQMLNGNPYISQPELWKSVLEADDPRLVRRLFSDPGEAQADQLEDQAVELAILGFGFPARVRPADNHEAHVATIVAHLDNLAAQRVTLAPMVAQALNAHLGQHMQALAQADPAKARQIAAALQQKMAQWSGGAPGQAQPQEVAA